MPSANKPATSLAAAVLLAVTGCNPVYFRTPNLLHPGPAGPQQLEAIYHDPYPLDDVGPEIVGGRPLGYQRPVPETARGRLRRSSPGGVVNVPVPAVSPNIVPAPTPGFSQGFAPAQPPVVMPQGF